MTEEIAIYRLQPTNLNTIEKIAQWYLCEWKIPIERTIHRLTHQTGDDILFHLVLEVNGVPAATGGLYNQVGLLLEHYRFKKYYPWVALLYTDINFRNRGLGATLLTRIEEGAKELGYHKIYLYTSTAESLYRRMGWKQMERTIYRGKENTVMEKEI